MTTPGPPRFPLYADEAGDSVEAHVEPRTAEAPPSHPTYFLDDHDPDDTGPAARWAGCPG